MVSGCKGFKYTIKGSTVIVTWITTKEAQQLTGLSYTTIRKYIKENKIEWQYNKALKRYRINKQSLLHYLEYKEDKE